MRNAILRLLITALALKGADYLLPNFNLHGGWVHLFWFSVVMGLLNWLVKPILVFFSIPFLIITVGLFYFVINALMLYFASLAVPGTLTATNGGILIASIVVTFLHWMLAVVFRVNKKEHTGD